MTDLPVSQRARLMGEIERELSGPPGSSDSRRKMLAEALTVIRDQASLLDEAADMLAAAPSSDSPAIPEGMVICDLEAIRMAYKTGYNEGYTDATDDGTGTGYTDRDACEEGWQQYLENLGLSKPTPASHTAPDALRTALIACGRHAGAILSDDVSDEFLSFIPEEVRLKLAALTTPAPADTNAALIEALTPSGSTKAAYHGEFFFETEDGVSNAGIERFRKVYVPWDTVKQIMEAIRARAALNQGRQAS